MHILRVAIAKHCSVISSKSPENARLRSSVEIPNTHEVEPAGFYKITISVVFFKQDSTVFID